MFLIFTTLAHKCHTCGFYRRMLKDFASDRNLLSFAVVVVSAFMYGMGAVKFISLKRIFELSIITPFIVHILR